MDKLNKALCALRATNYLDGKFCNKSHQLHITLLANGQRLSQQLQHKWQSATDTNVQTHFLANEYQAVEEAAPTSRMSFVHSNEFDNVLNFLKVKKLEVPVISKQLLTYCANSEEETNAAKERTIEVISSSLINKMRKYLVTDYFVPLSNGLEKFYNIQRERKIWWMTFSANPSRYTLEAYELPNANTGNTSITNTTTNNNNNHSSNNTQSITIKTRFNFGTMAMEHLTLVPAVALAAVPDTLSRPNELNQIIALNNSNSKAMSAVIRSVINLETATCGMLMDAYDCKRDGLRLNRKISPHQVMIVGMQSEQQPSNDLTDLCAYVSLLIREAGLRHYENVEMLMNDEESLNDALQKADSHGIPYTIIVENESLKYGLMKLRSRDTTLHETIHFTDIPEYLLKIFLST